MHAEKESRLRAVIDNVVDGIITIDEQGVVQSFNPACERIFGYRADEVIGQNVKMLMPQNSHNGNNGDIWHYREVSQGTVAGTTGREVWGRRRDGAVFAMEISVSTFELDGKRYFSDIIRDILRAVTS